MKPLTDIIILGSKPNKGMRSKGALSNISIAASQTVLDNQIKNLVKKINVNRILYVGGHGFEELKTTKYKNISFIKNTFYQQKNNAYSLGLGLKEVSSSGVLILFSKILFSHQIFNYFNYNESQIFISKHLDYKIGSIINNDKINNLSFNLNNKCCGIYYLTSNELKYIKSIYKYTNNLDNLFIFEIINRSIDLGAIYKPNFISDKKLLYEIKNNYTLEQLKKYYVKNFAI